MSIIAYTYEADTHCPHCAIARFGDRLDRAPSGDCAWPADSEGNDVHPLYEHEVYPLTNDRAGITCGTCLEPIYEDEITAAWVREYDYKATRVIFHAYDPDLDADSLPGFDWDAVREAWIEEGRFGDGYPDEVAPFIEAALIAYGEDILDLAREQEAACYATDLLALAV